MPTGGGLKLQALISHSPGGWTSTITMPAGSVSGGALPPRCPSSRRALAWRDKEYVLVPSRRSRPPRNLTTSKRSHARGWGRPGRLTGFEGTHSIGGSGHEAATVPLAPLSPLPIRATSAFTVPAE